MNFTGERYIPTEAGKIRLEHYHRYASVLDFIKDKEVLDIACGEGYGSSYMADFARSVVGVDISGEAVDHAAKTYKKPNLSFAKGNAAEMNFPDNSFDVVVSFETIEHLSEQSKMLAEIRRLLRPDGILIISSPNRPIYSEESGESNDFHVKELDFEEFDNLLKEQFPAVKYFGQRILMGSVIQSLEGGQGNYKAWHDNGRDLLSHSGALTDPVYFIAVAGEDKLFLPEISPSVNYPSDLDLVKHYVGFAKWAKNQDAAIAERDKYIADLSSEIATRDKSLSDYVSEIANLSRSVTERDAQINNLHNLIAERETQITDLHDIIAERNAQIVTLNDETVRRGEWALRLEAELDVERESGRTLREIINSLVNSNSWRLTLPLREARLWGLTPGEQSRRYLKKSLVLAKRVYQKLPLKIETIENQRGVIERFVPRLLEATNTRRNGKEVAFDSKEIRDHFINSSPHQESQFFKAVSDQFENAKTIEISSSEEPSVSVIIPIFGKIGYTLNCLASIAANPPRVPFEIIVVDDRSPDNSVKVLENVRGIRLIKNKENQGFIRSCNIGAEAAKGEYLYFLNNDTQVTPGWMDELVRTFYEFPGTGLAGSKLVYPDGQLQEAGGIIWQDGSAWNFGRFQDARLPVYNYAREVDYCSGASIMIPKILFAELGGFDEHYLPAYCEDSDIALKIREKGFRVVYQPFSTIIHYEGISSGTDESQGTKAYQVQNSKKLYSRWKSRLARHQINGNGVDKAKDRRAQRRVLVLEHCTPTPDKDAGSVTVFNLMLLLREMDFQVTFIPEDNFLYMPEYTTDLQRVGIEMLYAPHVMSVEEHLKEYGSRYDLIFLFRPKVVERNINTIKKYCPQAKTLYHTVDLHFLRMLREAELKADESTYQKAQIMKQREYEIIRTVDASIVHSTAELDLLRPELSDAKIFVFPLILSVEGTQNNFDSRDNIVFVGSYQHPPNVDAVKYFVTEIMPLLRRSLPGVVFCAVGSNPPSDITDLATDDVIFTGFVENLSPLLGKARISIAPLRYGAGIKGKIGTAMAAGLPVVATSLAVEGMSLQEGENIITADGSKNFAEAIVRLYEDEELWNKISEKGLDFANKNWGAEAAWQILSQIIGTLGIYTAHNKYPLSLYSEFDLIEAKKKEKSIDSHSIITSSNNN